MLRITKAQLATFEVQQLTAFLARVKAFAEVRLHIPVRDDTLRVLFGRGRVYGLITEQEFAGYIFIALAAGGTETQADPDWIVACLSDTTRMPELRLEELFHEATTRLHEAKIWKAAR